MVDSIKLLHLLNTFEDGSNNRLVLNLTKGLDPNKYQLHVGCIESTGGPLETEFLQAGAITINFGMRNYFDLCVIDRLRKYIKSKEIDIVHTHILRADILGWLGIYLEHTPHLVSTKHNLNFSPGQSGWFWRNPLYRLALFLPDLVVAVSEAMREQLITVYKLKSNQVVTIYNGIDVDLIDKCGINSRLGLSMRTGCGLSSDDFIVAYIGRLVEGKGLIDLLHAMQMVVSLHRECFLVIIGDGPLLELLKNKANDLGLGANVIFTGFRSDIPDILAEIDILTLPSLSEGLPLSVLEAMAAGKSVIATPVGGIKEIIKVGETGLLIPPKNPGALADAILLLLLNEKLRKDLGLKAQAFVRRDFNIRVMVDKYDITYQSLYNREYLTPNKMRK